MSQRPADELGRELEAEAKAPSVAKLVLRIGAGLVVLLVTTAVVARVFHRELEIIGHAFVDRFGLVGMALGSFIADGFHFPIPPQFYMLMGVTSGVPAIKTLIAVNIGSFFGGWCAYFLANRVSHFPPLARRLAATRRITDGVFARYGSWSVVVASFLPLTYALLCYLCGLSRLPRSGFAIVALLRVPRLVAYYYLVELGWLAA